MTRVEVAHCNAKVIAMHLDREERAAEHFECPVCKREVSIEKGAACVDCTVKALTKAGWL